MSIEKPDNKKENMYVLERVMVNPFLEELNNYLTANSWSSTRARNVHVQKETLAIVLRATTGLVRKNDSSSFHTQFSIDTKIQPSFSNLMQFLHGFSKRRNSILSRVMIVKLLPEKQVYPHIDFGEYYEIRDRYHLVLSSDGSKMISGSEEKVFHTGDLFYFNNHEMHEAYNLSEKERIHVIFDMLPKNLYSYVKVSISVIKTLFFNSIYSIKKIFNDN